MGDSPVIRGLDLDYNPVIRVLDSGCNLAIHDDPVLGCNLELDDVLGLDDEVH